MDEAAKMARMDAWLDDVCAALALDREPVRALQPSILALVGDVAHGPSRPGAPLTAFLVGLAAGKAGGNVEDDVREALAKLAPLLVS